MKNIMKKQKRFTVLIILFLMSSDFMLGQSYLNFPIDTVVSDQFYNYRAYLRYDNSGKIHLVNSRQLGTNSATREIFYWNNVSGEMIPYRVTNNSVDDNYVTIGFDQDEKIHLGWERRDAANLFQLIYTNNRNTSAGFGDSVWITAGGLNKATPYMAVGKNDSSVHFVYMTFVTGQDNAYYKKYNYISGTLGPETTLGSAEASSENDIQIAVDGNGKLHIVYTTNHSAGSGTLKYFNNEPGNITEMPAGVSDLVSYPQITIDNANVVHIVYRRTGDNRLYTISRPSGGSFNSPAAITPSVGLPSFYRAMNTDDTRRLFVTYQNSNSSFPRGTFLVHGKDGIFSEPILVFEDSTSTYIGRGNSSVAARGNGEIAVHFEATASRSGTVVSDIFIKEGTLITTGISQSQSYSYSIDEHGYKLYDNYPNPFNPKTSISYFLPSGDKVKLKVYDILGNVVSTLVNEFKPQGIHSVIFDAKDISSGIYFYSLEAGEYTDRKKMIILK
jgi:hypothetical protein